MRPLPDRCPKCNPLRRGILSQFHPQVCRFPIARLVFSLHDCRWRACEIVPSADRLILRVGGRVNPPPFSEFCSPFVTESFGRVLLFHRLRPQISQHRWILEEKNFSSFRCISTKFPLTAESRQFQVLNPAPLVNKAAPAKVAHQRFARPFSSPSFLSSLSDRLPFSPLPPSLARHG